MLTYQDCEKNVREFVVSDKLINKYFLLPNRKRGEPETVHKK